MGALGDSRAEIVALLEAQGIAVKPSPSTGHIVPPAALVSPGAEWLTIQAQLGRDFHGRLALSITFIAGKQAAAASLAELEALIEQAAPVLAGAKWQLTAVGQPFGLSIANTEYLAATATLTRQIVIAAAAA
jgi:hypothetical protein